MLWKLCVGSLTSILIFCWSLVTWRLKNLLLLPSLLRYFFVETPGGNLCCFANRFLGVDTKVISISYCTYSTLPLKLLQKKLWLREKGHVIKQNTLNRLSGSTDQHCRANNAINSSDILSRQQQWNITVNSRVDSREYRSRDSREFPENIHSRTFPGTENDSRE